MNPERWRSVKAAFAAVIERPAAERSEYIASLADDVRDEVARMAADYDAAADFIDTPYLGTRDSGSDDQELPFKEIENYRLVRKIGEGGMGSVFLAERRDREFSHRVALKLVKRGMDTDQVLRRFLNERQILADLDHPSIARLFDGGTSPDGVPYFVMEFIEGVPITRFCDQNSLTVKRRLELFVKVCDAVAYAHRNLVVHRDLKPSNILVPADETPKLVDFGIARVLMPNARSGESTAPFMRAMTPEYASPEQIRGAATTTSSDVYSLGVVLYELLSGVRPFRARDGEPDRLDDPNLIPPRPSAAAADLRDPAHDPRALTGDLDNIVMMAVRPEPERRYGSVQEFAADIRRFLDGRPVRATPDSTPYRLRKFIVRHRSWVAVAATFSAMLILGIAVSAWQYVTVRNERAKAEQRLHDLRNVARTLLTDTSRALENLPEGIEVQRSIVEKSVAVLDKLARDENDDAVFLGELGDAYNELGKIRHWHFHESRNALGDFQKSLDLNQRAERLAPRSIDIKRRSSTILGNMLEVYMFIGDRVEMLSAASDQLRVGHQILELDPDNPQVLFELSVQTERLGDYYGYGEHGAEQNAKYAESRALIERAIGALDLKPRDAANELSRVTFGMQLGEILNKTGHPDEARAKYSEAAALSQRLYESDPANKFAFNHASRTHRLMADIDAARGDWNGFLENSQFSVDWIRNNAMNKNLDGRHLPSSEAFYLVRTAIALEKLGQPDEAASRVTTALEIYRRHLRSHPNDGEDIVYAPEMLETVTGFYVETGQWAKAAKLWSEFATLIEPFVARNPDDTESLGFLAYALERRADMLSRYDKTNATFGATDPDNLAAAARDYAESRGHYEKMLNIDPDNEIRVRSKNTVQEKWLKLESMMVKTPRPSPS